MDPNGLEMAQSVGVESVKEESQPSKKTLTPRKIKILAAVISGNLFLGSCYSLMAPFFPAEAESKGATATEYGFVFGVYQLIMFLTAPIYGKLAPVLRPGFMMKAGMLVSGICMILFGCLKFTPPGKLFVGLAFTIRIIDAMGASAFLTASYTTLACEFPDIIGRAISLVETSFAFGLAGGPVLGGILYQAGGFITPFVAIGSLLLMGTIVNFMLFSDADAGVSASSGSTRKLMTDIDFLINMLANFSCLFLLGFNEATLEPHLRQFFLSPATIGGVFLISGILDATTAPLWGFVAEKMSNCHHLMLVGCILFMICFLIIGPVPFFHQPTLLWVVIVSQVLLGLGMAIILVCSFTHGLKESVARGFPDEVSTYSLVSGLLFSCACLGGFLGPSLGGYLIDMIGYEYATTVVSGFQILVVFVIVMRLSWLYTRKKKPTSELNISQKTIEEEKC